MDDSTIRAALKKHGVAPKPFERWWEPRRAGELTTEFLGRVLDDAGQPDLARRARQGHFDDYFCPPEVADGMETIRLVVELDRAAHSPRTNREGRERLLAMIEGVKSGEWDATKDESDRWAASKDGQDTFRALVEGR